MVVIPVLVSGSSSPTQCLQVTQTHTHMHMHTGTHMAHQRRMNFTITHSLSDYHFIMVCTSGLNFLSESRSYPFEWLPVIIVHYAVLEDKTSSSSQTLLKLVSIFCSGTLQKEGQQQDIPTSWCSVGITTITVVLLKPQPFLLSKSYVSAPQDALGNSSTIRTTSSLTRYPAKANFRPSWVCLTIH